MLNENNIAATATYWVRGPMLEALLILLLLTNPRSSRNQFTCKINPIHVYSVCFHHIEHHFHPSFRKGVNIATGTADMMYSLPREIMRVKYLKMSQLTPALLDRNVCRNILHPYSEIPQRSCDLVGIIPFPRMFLFLRKMVQAL